VQHMYHACNTCITYHAACACNTCIMRATPVSYTAYACNTSFISYFLPLLTSGKGMTWDVTSLTFESLPPGIVLHGGCSASEPRSCPHVSRPHVSRPHVV